MEDVRQQGAFVDHGLRAVAAVEVGRPSAGQVTLVYDEPIMVDGSVLVSLYVGELVWFEHRGPAEGAVVERAAGAAPLYLGGLPRPQARDVALPLNGGMTAHG